MLKCFFKVAYLLPDAVELCTLKLILNLPRIESINADGLRNTQEDGLSVLKFILRKTLLLHTISPSKNSAVSIENITRDI